MVLFYFFFFQEKFIFKKSTKVFTEKGKTDISKYSEEDSRETKAESLADIAN